MQDTPPPPPVEPVSSVAARDGDTFITQRAGKMATFSVNGPGQLYLPIQNEQSPSMFENRRTLQSTLLLQKKREMNQVQANLEKKRVEFAKRMEECREKQEELRAKQKQIRDRVTKFEKFLKENDAKRQRANLKAQTEKKLREQKVTERRKQEQELGALSHTLGDEQVKSENILKLIKKYQIYERYLQSVVDVLPPDYLDVNEPHINDILMRYKTLVETNEDLIRTVQQSQDGIEHEAAKLAELIKEKNDQILVYNSKLGTQQKRLDILKLESAYIEQKLEERDNTGKERMRMLGETKLAIHNIYERIVNHARSSSLPIAKPAFLMNLLSSDTTAAPRASNANPGTAPGGPGLPGGAANMAGVGGGNAGNVGIPTTNKELDNSARSLTEKLHFVQERLLDLQHISTRAEQSIAQERAERVKKQAALAAELAAAAKS
ncbi:hypothetical protein HK101_006323 [Irineochytrium annulatum]|nr:hypothetical protein HK101_006323 [Irineochytrium annulatum]